GAYHIFVPALVKPGPAGLATLLWALKNDARDKPGYGDVVAALAAGRTSFVTDPSFERAFYRLSGFRNLGRRAVRVDILERLADLIRPALAWKPGQGRRPEGAYGGDAFVVTPAMMSILGATAEDMEAILKGLGYRAESRTADEVSARLEELDRAAEAEAAGREAAAAAEAGAAEADGSAAPAADGTGQGNGASDESAEAGETPATAEAEAADGQDAASAEAEAAELSTAAAPAQQADVNEPEAGNGT